MKYIEIEFAQKQRFFFVQRMQGYFFFLAYLQRNAMFCMLF